ncbi:recombinase family protein [Clostridium botulinum]|uniref:recombinase family protein n=1 Tax=Clostridium botulinum TaxID=1491 RepID=UPI001FAEBE31|nr:recombinase family protein [Clostridium botulinum]
MVDELNSRGFKTKVGAMFKSNSINSVLSNEKYTGVYVFNKSAKKDAYGRRNSHLQKAPSEIIRIEGGIPRIIDKELYEKAQEILRSRKKSKAVNKAKESYLLSGIIKCGECDYSMYGNRRQAKDKPLYVSYICSCRKNTSSNVCNNKEIRKDYIEEYVLTELEARIFNDKSIPLLVEGINENLKNQNKGDEDKRAVFEKELKEIEKQIGNIVTAITNGFMQEEFKVKMEELKDREIYLEGKLVELEASQSVNKVTEEDIKSLLSGFKEYVLAKNIPECKNFIQDFVKEVIVYKTRVEVVFNVGFNFFKSRDFLKKSSRILRNNLYKSKYYIKLN